MRVTFWDERRETFERVENVWMVESTWQKTSSGHLSKFWTCHLEDGKSRTFQKKYYSIYQIAE